LVKGRLFRGAENLLLPVRLALGQAADRHGETPGGGYGAQGGIGQGQGGEPLAEDFFQLAKGGHDIAGRNFFGADFKEEFVLHDQFLAIFF